MVYCVCTTCVLDTHLPKKCIDTAIQLDTLRYMDCNLLPAQVSYSFRPFSFFFFLFFLYTFFFSFILISVLCSIFLLFFHFVFFLFFPPFPLLCFFFFLNLTFVVDTTILVWDWRNPNPTVRRLGTLPEGYQANVCT